MNKTRGYRFLGTAGSLLIALAASHLQIAAQSSTPGFVVTQTSSAAGAVFVGTATGAVTFCTSTINLGITGTAGAGGACVSLGKVPAGTNLSIVDSQSSVLILFPDGRVFQCPTVVSGTGSATRAAGQCSASAIGTAAK